MSKTIAIDLTQRSHERERVDLIRKGHLPRLRPAYYRGHAFVHWTLTIEHRATGWLTPRFHDLWRLTLLHACARYHLAIPVYVLMPDHIHVLAAGLAAESDQRTAIEFLRRHLRAGLAPADWQQQTYDHVLRADERARGALQATARYISENPVRAGLVTGADAYPYGRCCVVGYPDLNVHAPGYWESLWRIYNRLVG